MTVTYGPHLQRIWREALLLPGFETLLDSLCYEVGEYLGVSGDEAHQLIRSAWDGRAEEMTAGLPAGLAADELERYYAEKSSGVLTSAYWHSLEPDRFALHSVSGLSALQHFSAGSKVFEFGHGIGSTAVLLARSGFDVTAGDISSAYREFARQRTRRRSLDVAYVDLTSEEVDAGTFDAVVSFDVLEHVRDPIHYIENMHTWLKPDGLLVLNIAFGRDPSNPEHIQPYRLGVVDRIRGLGFERIEWPTLLVFAKRSVGSVRRLFYRVQDVVGAAGDDLAARSATAARVLRRTWLPPIG